MSNIKKEGNDIKASSFNIYDFKLDCEGETVELKQSTGVAKTSIPFEPLHDTVIVRGIFEDNEASLYASDDKTIERLRRNGSEKTVVVAVAGNIKDINVGDEVAMPYNPGIQQLDLPDNKRSIRNTIKYLKDPNRKTGLDKQFRRVKMVEYVIAPAIAIKGRFIEL